jgi:O-antigen/teichoic acid export membrane protein
MSLAGTLCLTSFTNPLADLIVRSSVLRTGGLTLLGLFQAAFGLAVILRTTVRPTFALFFIPALNRHLDNAAKLQEAAHFTFALSRMLGIIALPLVLFPDWCLILVYSKAFVLAAPILCLFTLAIVIQLLGAVNLNLLIALDCTATYLWSSLLGDVAVAAFAWYLAPFLGIAGVAIAYLSASSLLFALTAILLRLRYGMSMLGDVGWFPFYVVAAIGIGGASATWLHLPLVLLLPVRVALCVGLSLPLICAKSYPRSSLRPECLAYSLPIESTDRQIEPESEESHPVASVYR